MIGLVLVLVVSEVLVYSDIVVYIHNSISQYGPTLLHQNFQRHYSTPSSPSLTMSSTCAAPSSVAPPFHTLLHLPSTLLPLFALNNNTHLKSIQPSKNLTPSTRHYRRMVQMRMWRVVAGMDLALGSLGSVYSGIWETMRSPGGERLNSRI